MYSCNTGIHYGKGPTYYLASPDQSVNLSDYSNHHDQNDNTNNQQMHIIIRIDDDKIKIYILINQNEITKI